MSRNFVSKVFTVNLFSRYERWATDDPLPAQWSRVVWVAGVCCVLFQFILTSTVLAVNRSVVESTVGKNRHSLTVQPIQLPKQVEHQQVAVVHGTSAAVRMYSKALSMDVSEGIALRGH